MAKKNLSFSGSPMEIAEKLVKINGEILAYEEPLKALKMTRDELRITMLDSLKANHMSSVGTDEGITFSKAVRAGYEITDKEKAMKWAISHNCAKVDTAKLGKLLNGNGEAIPDGFGYTTTEYLATKGIKDALID